MRRVQPDELKIYFERTAKDRRDLYRVKKVSPVLSVEKDKPHTPNQLHNTGGSIDLRA